MVDKENLIEIICLAADFKFYRKFICPHGYCVSEAILASGFCDNLDFLANHNLSVGIFARRVSFDTIVKPDDRIEIYAPLKHDPKDARRRRAKQQKQTKLLIDTPVNS